MTLVMKTNGVKAWIIRDLKTHYTVKLAAGLALGALMLAATSGFPFRSSGPDAQQSTMPSREGATNSVAPEQMIPVVDHDMFDHLPEGTHWGMDAEIEWGFNQAVGRSKEPGALSPSFNRQRALDRYQENLDILQAMRVSGVVNAEVVANTYEQRRTADRHIENLDILQRVEVSGASDPAVPRPSQSLEVVPSMADPYDRSLHDDVIGEEQIFTTTLLKADKVQQCHVLLGEEWFHPVSGELTAPPPEWIRFDNQANTYVKQDC